MMKSPRRVRLILDKDPFMKADHIRVYTKDHIVPLEGRVPNDSIREMAEFDAWYVCRVDGVINSLTVRKYT
jgi:osmotically-inducible protein OsmY